MLFVFFFYYIFFCFAASEQINLKMCSFSSNSENMRLPYGKQSKQLIVSVKLKTGALELKSEVLSLGKRKEKEQKKHSRFKSDPIETILILTGSSS